MIDFVYIISNDKIYFDNVIMNNKIYFIYMYHQ